MIVMMLKNLLHRTNDIYSNIYSLQYKKVNLANFVLAVALEMNYTNEVYNLKT